VATMADTGSDDSLVSEESVAKMPSSLVQWVSREGVEEYTTASGDPLRTCGTVRLPLYIGASRSRCVELRVTKQLPVDALFGLDVLMQVGARVDLPKREMEFLYYDAKVPMAPAEGLEAEHVLGQTSKREGSHVGAVQLDEVPVDIKDRSVDRAVSGRPQSARGLAELMAESEGATEDPDQKKGEAAPCRRDHQRPIQGSDKRGVREGSCRRRDRDMR
jgi:hypothetical protein